MISSISPLERSSRVSMTRWRPTINWKSRAVLTAAGSVSVFYIVLFLVRPPISFHFPHHRKQYHLLRILSSTSPPPEDIQEDVLEELAENDTCYCMRPDKRLENFCYRLPENENVTGRRFSCDHMQTAYNLDVLDIRLSSVEYDMLEYPVMVAAASSSHYDELARLLRFAKKHASNLKIIVYDLGLSVDQVAVLYNVCGIEYRKFNFDAYPPSVRKLTQYRWKPIIIAEVLREYESMWYMDSSVLLKKSTFSRVYDLIRCREHTTPMHIPSIEDRDNREAEQTINVTEETTFNRNVKECRKSSYLLHSFTGHGIYPVTSPGMYKFLPTNFSEIRKPKAKMYEAGFAYIVRTDDMVMSVLKWYVLCALEEECMAPTGSFGSCAFTDDRYGGYADCHRFDQSAINILLANNNYYDRHYYTSELTDFFKIKREVDEDELRDLHSLICPRPILVDEAV